MNPYQVFQVRQKCTKPPVENSHGGTRPGAGRPPGSHNKLTRPVRELAAEQGEASIIRLIELRDHAESEQVRFAAAKELLDRACGRPRQEFGVTEDNTVRVIIDRGVRMPQASVVQAAIEHHSSNGNDAQGE